MFTSRLRPVVLYVLSVVVLAGCGGGSSTPKVSAADLPVPAVISGGPPTVVPTPTATPTPTQTGAYGRYLYTVNEDRSAIQSWRIDAGTGRLVANGLTDLPNLPLSFRSTTLAVAGPFVYVPDTISSGTIAAYGIQSNGNLFPLQPPLGLTGQPALVGMRVAANRRFGCAIDISGRLYPLSIDPNSGRIEQGGAPLALPAAPATITYTPLVIDPTSRFVYTVIGGAVDTLAIGPTGGLTLIGSTAATPGATVADVDPSGRWLYVAGTSTNVVSQYALDATSGLPSPLSPATVATGRKPTGLACDPTGHYVFVSNADDASVTSFSIGGGGALTPVTTALTGGSAVSALAVDPSGQNLYVGQSDTALVATLSHTTQFRIGSGGSLTMLPSRTRLQTLASLRTAEMQISSGASYVKTQTVGAYVLNSAGANGRSSISSYRADAVTGELVSLGAEVSLPDAGPASAIAAATLSSGSRVLYAAERLRSQIVVFALNDDGTLGQPLVSTQLQGGLVDPVALQVDPTNRYLYVVSRNGGGNSFVTAMEIRDDGSLLMAAGSSSISTTLPNAGRIAQGADGVGLYVTHACAPSQPCVFAANAGPIGLLSTPPATLTPNPTGVGRGSSPLGLALAPGLPWLVTANSGDGSFSTLGLDAFGGFFTLLQNSVVVSANPVAVTFEPFGQYFYIANGPEGTNGRVRTYRVDPTGGTLLGGIAAGRKPVALQADVSGRFIYVANGNDGGTGSVMTYAIGADGTLAQVGGAVTAGTNPVDMIVVGACR